MTIRASSIASGGLKADFAQQLIRNCDERRPGDSGRNGLVDDPRAELAAAGVNVYALFHPDCARHPEFVERGPKGRCARACGRP